MKAIIILLFLSFFLSLCNPLTGDEWFTRGGGVHDDYGTTIARDNNGNIYVGGRFFGATTIGINFLTSAGGYDIFVAKLDANGNWLWAMRAGGSGNDYCEGISATGDGSVYITGYFENTAMFGIFPLTSSGNSDLFAAKLTTDGAWLWANKGGGTYIDRGQDITTDSSGNCFIIGYFCETAAFGAVNLTSVSNEDCVVAKLNTDGVWQWAVAASGTREQWGLGIAYNYSYGLYITGMFNTDITCGSTTLTAVGGSYSKDAFIARLSISGSWIWARQVGSLSPVYGRDLTVDGSGRVTVIGEFNGTASCGPITLSSSGSTDAFITSLDRNGAWLWAVSAGGTDIDIGADITEDVDGNFYITGYFNGLAHFGATELTTGADQSSFISKLDYSGNFLWARQAQNCYNSGEGICCLNNGSCFTVGYYSGTIIFGNNILYLSGSSDIYVVKISDPEPQPPEDMEIYYNGYNVHVDWSENGYDTWDEPLDPDYYFVYYNTTGSNYPFLYLTFVPGFLLTYTHQNAGYFSSVHFYQVTAVKLFGNNRSSEAMESWLSEHLRPGMTKSEVESELTKISE